MILKLTDGVLCIFKEQNTPKLFSIKDLVYESVREGGFLTIITLLFSCKYNFSKDNCTVRRCRLGIYSEVSVPFSILILKKKPRNDARIH